MVLPERERPGLEQRQGQRRLGSAGGGEEDAEATVGVADQVGAVAHEGGDVLGVAQEVLTLGRRAAPVAPAVRRQQAKAFAGEGPLRLPLLGRRGQRTVHEHNRRAVAPLLDVQTRARRVGRHHRGLLFPSDRGVAVVTRWAEGPASRCEVAPLTPRS
jgi:hypothetical protein